MEGMNSAGSSIKRRSLSVSSHASHTTDNDDAECDSVSEAGDIGDRALPSIRLSDSDTQNGALFFSLLLSEDPLNCYLKPLPPEFTSATPLSSHAVLGSQDAKQEPRRGLPKWLDYASIMIHLAVFGILGVLTRYLLQKLFGPGGAGVTNDQSILYLDLPSNMVGSFFMGWFGVIFKGDISHVSEHLAIAITSGYIGSFTTFSGWNQKMLELSVSGHWLFSALGFLIGLFLIAFTIQFGIETAKGFRWLLNRKNMSSGIGNSKINCKVGSCRCQLAFTVMSLVMLGILWGVSVAVVKAKFKHGDSAAWLWFACMVGPIGTWIRWFLARLNGRGIGKAELFKWIPFGTLIANVLAACVVAALASVKKAVNTRNCDTVVGGIQFGILGNLSTASTFIAEFNAMRESCHPWRAYAYASITVCLSFSFGILIYCVPAWTRGFDIDT